MSKRIDKQTAKYKKSTGFISKPVIVGKLKKAETNIDKLRKTNDGLLAQHYSMLGQLAIYQVLAGPLDENLVRQVFAKCPHRGYKAPDFFKTVLQAAQERIAEIDALVAKREQESEAKLSEQVDKLRQLTYHDINLVETPTAESPTRQDSADMSTPDAWD